MKAVIFFNIPPEPKDYSTGYPGFKLKSFENMQ
jgi:hypothetical protein